MAWRTDYAAAAERDFELIFDHLFASYQSVGDPVPEALERAASRIGAIRQAGDSLAKAPHRGTLRDDIGPGLRHVTIDRAVYWFELDEATETIRILAIFFGRQDQVRHMLTRLLQPPDTD